MSDVEHISVVQHIPLSELELRIKTVSDEIGKVKRMERAKTRLQFIRLKYKGYSTVDASDALGINHQTGYNWLKGWNENGLNFIEPNFSGGPKSRLSEEQRWKFKLWVERENPTTKEALEYIRKNYGVEYTPTHLNRLMTSLGFKHAKPYLIDRRRPEDSEEILKKTSEMRWIPSETGNSSSDSKTNR